MAEQVWQSDLAHPRELVRLPVKCLFREVDGDVDVDAGVDVGFGICADTGATVVSDIVGLTYRIVPVSMVRVGKG